jgi:phage terminase large subunit-like protein
VLGAVGGDLRLVFAAPPQHGKTEVTLALIAFLVLEHPGRRWAYVTYNDRRTKSVARKFRRLLVSVGVLASGTLAQMYLPGGGQILFTSVDGGITGEPVDGAVFVDDPYKNRKEADSQARRELVLDTYREAIETRVHPGASVIVLATRWHPQDLSGTLIEEGWDYINLQAIAEGPVNDNGVCLDDANGRRPGEALFPEKWSAEELEKKRARLLDYAFAALYQGRPRPKGGKVFHEPTYYTRLPSNYRGCFGVDLAYTARTSGDWSICLELWRDEDTRPGEDPVYYVVHVDRAQVEAPEFTLTLKARNFKHKGTWSMHWRASGTEKGSASFIKNQGIPLKISQPPGDKLVSATPAAAAWNAGRIRLPDPEQFPGCEDWLYPFLDVVGNFTGTGREKDDDVDALGNAFAELDKESRSGAYGAARARLGNRPKPRA